MPPRLATAQFLRRLNKLALLYKPLGLEHFDGLAVLTKNNLLEGVRTGKFSDMAALVRFLDAPAPPSFSVATDEEQLQITGLDYADSRLGLAEVHHHDWFHRASNDLATSIAIAGCMPVYWASLFFMNIGYGPWQSAAWFHLFVAQTRMLNQQLQPDSILPLRFWPRILVDQRKHLCVDEETVGKKARAEYIRTMPMDEICQFKSIKVKPSIWMSWQQAYSKWDPFLGTRAMVLSSCCINKGLIPTHEELFSIASGIGCPAPDMPKAKSKAQEVRNAKAKVEAVKKKAQSHVAAAAKVLCDQDCINGTRILGLGTRAVFEEFNKVTDELTSYEKTTALCHEWTQWSWLQALKDTLRVRGDTLELSRCGIRVAFPANVVKTYKKDDPVVLYEDSLSATLTRLTSSIVSTRSGSMTLWTDEYPFKLVGILFEATAKRTMDMFKRDVSAWWAAKDILFLYRYVGVYIYI